MTGRDSWISPLPRLLKGVPAQGAMTLDQHLATHGEAPLARGRRKRRGSPELIDLVERAGLRGRGGAGFPAARKMRGVHDARGRAIVVVNAAEGEPASEKDRTLLRVLPHLVLDGGLLAAQALGADEVIACVCELEGGAISSLQLALAERGRASGGARVRIATVPAGYVSGQESALVNHLNGGPALPTFTPPLPFERGVAQRPTLVNNAETLAHLALIARHGPKWFRELGTDSEPGSTLITLSGPVAYPGVYEIEPGSSLSSLIDAAGGLTAPIRAALLGGYGGNWVATESPERLALSSDGLSAHGASLGAGVVALISEQACGVAETARITRWLAGQSARQCGPCINGLDAIAGSLEEVAAGIAAARARQQIARFATLARGRGACAHPDGAVRLVVSALQLFGDEFTEHASYGHCDGCTRAELPLAAHSRALVGAGR